MKKRKAKLMIALVAAAMVIGSCPNSVYASETGEDIVINSGEDEVEGADQIPEEQNFIDIEDENTDTENKGRTDEAADIQEDYAPYEAVDYVEDEASSTEEQEELQENVQYLANAAISGEWVQEENGLWWYRHADGSFTISDWEYIDGEWFYFDHYGWMQTGWIQLEGKWYYLKNWGAMATGCMVIDDENFYFQSDGIMVTGWLQLDGKWYYLKNWGAMAKGWLQVEDNYYYFSDSGIMATGWLKYEGEWYYLKSWGGMVKGWFQLENKWYYFYDSGIMAVGWVQLEDKWYYFYASGAMATGWVHLGVNDYYFYSSGVMAIGWEHIGANYYYFETTGVMAANQWKKIGDAWYYFYSTGVMATGWVDVGGKTYYCKSTGVRVSGTYQVEGIPYYFSSDGVLDMGQSVVNYAMQFIGNPYVWGGESLTNGCDCSGFTMKVFEKFGIKIPRTSGEQRSSGTAVGSLSAARPGDLLCYDGHVGIYIGNGEMVNASNSAPFPDGGIKLTPANYRTIITIRRLV